MTFGDTSVHIARAHLTCSAVAALVNTVAVADATTVIAFQGAKKCNKLSKNSSSVQLSLCTRQRTKYFLCDGDRIPTFELRLE